MVGKNILAAATVYIALASALALPKDKSDDKLPKHHDGDDDKPHLPHKPGRGPGGDDEDCSSSLVPYPTGAEPTAPGFPTGGSGTISIIAPTGTGIFRRNAHPDKGRGGKDDSTASITGTSSVEDNPSRTADDNGSASATATGVSSVEDNPDRTATGASGIEDNPSRTVTGADDTTTTTVTLTSTITAGPTITITLTPTTSTSSSTSRGRKGRKTRSSDDSTIATSTTSTTSTSTVDDNSAPTTTNV